MKQLFQTYGVAAGSLLEARAAVEAALALRLVEHDSGYRGGVYYRYAAGDFGELILQRNYDDFEGEWFEPEHQEYGFILYASKLVGDSKLVNQLAADRTAKLLTSKWL